jgi:hypothetical protein
MGRGIERLFAEGENLHVEYSDGTKANLGRFVGRDGKDGVAGARGAPGRDGKDGISPPAPEPSVKIVDAGPASLSAKDIDRLHVVEMEVDGQTLRFLALS